MSVYGALALYPLWAVSLMVAATSLRLGRGRGRGLTVLASSIAFWVSGLIMLEQPTTQPLAEHLLAFGMLMGAGFIHAGLDVIGERVTLRRRRALLGGSYAFAALVASSGAVAPGIFHTPGLRGPGPMFWPLFVIGAIGTVLTLGGLLRAALTTRGVLRRQLFALTLGCVSGSAGGGVSVAAHLLGAFSVRLAAPLLLPAVLLVTYAVVLAEPGPARALFRRAIGYATLTAAFTAVGLPLFILALPSLTPAPGFLWLAVVSFSAALPLDAIRNLVVERAGRALFREPIGVPDLAQRAEASEARAEQAEALAQVGTLASAVAHEIRNPLGVIQAQAKLLERTGARPESVAALRTQVDRAKRFLDDLLRYAKPKPVEPADNDVHKLVARTVADLRAAHPDMPEVTLAIEEGLRLEADPHALSDVITVLVANAAAALHGRDGGSIRVVGARADHAVRVAVEDDGPGVPAAIAPRLFTPFVSGRGRDHPHPGTGLGLAIAARWLERHRGTLTHEIPEGGGARFVSVWPDA